MTDAELDAVYTRLCQTLTTLGEPQANLFLARFSLLALVQIGDEATVQRLLDAAAQGLEPPAKP